MSGICGMCEVGSEFGAESLAPMLDSLSLPGDVDRLARNGRSASLGVARRWAFQSVSSVEHLQVAADADLVEFDSVAKALSVSRAAASSMSTAELFARLYLRHGIDFVKLLDGAFAFVLWDGKANRFVFAIDKFGVKSLYWRQEGSRILCASRISALRRVQRSPVETDPTAILQFLLFSAVPAPQAVDAGTRKLRPGTVITFENESTQETQYWDLAYPESSETDVTCWARELREELRSAVQRSLEGCDPISTGCYLSGGTDSSSVLAFASEKRAPMRSFSIAFQESAFSEIDFARTSASAYRSIHRERFLSSEDAYLAVEKIVRYFDEPFANSSAIGSYYCAELAKQNGVDTLLAGDGGDELFAGNERYATDKRFALYHHLPLWFRTSIVEPLTGMLPNNGSKLSLPRKYVRRAKIPNPRRILSYGFFLSSPPSEIFEDGFLQKVGTEGWLAIPEEHYGRAIARTDLNRILYLDVKMTLADNDLRKVSGTAEMAGVNVRYPFLDERLASFSGRIPSSLKLKGFKKRYIFKEAMKEILPQKVLNKKKHGFGVPLAQWLLQHPRMRELTQDVLHDRRTRQRGYFSPSFFTRLMDLHSKEPNFYGEIVWYLLALELWHRTHLERSRDSIHAY